MKLLYKLQCFLRRHHKFGYRFDGGVHKRCRCGTVKAIVKRKVKSTTQEVA